MSRSEKKSMVTFPRTGGASGVALNLLAGMNHGGRLIQAASEAVRIALNGFDRDQSVAPVSRGRPVLVSQPREQQITRLYHPRARIREGILATS